MHWEMLDYPKSEVCSLLSGNYHVISHSPTHHVIGHFFACKQARTGDVAINVRQQCQQGTIGHRIGENRTVIDNPIHFDP